MPGPTASVPTNRLLEIPGESAEASTFMAISVALASELSLTRMRLDTLERVLEHLGIGVRDAIEAFEPSPDDSAERSALRAHAIDRVFRVFAKAGQTELDEVQGEAREKDSI